MKKALVGVCLMSLLALMVGCTSNTPYGSCIGLGEEPDPKLTYKVSAQNLAVGLIFVETIIVPVIVAADQFYCPTGVKQ